MLMNDILDNFKEIDITDKTILQEQFNYCRKQLYDCIKTIESTNKKIERLKKELMNISVSVYKDPNITTTQANVKLKGDEDYQQKMIEIDCYNKTIEILNDKLDFIKSDIKILSNSMYNKF